MQRIHLHECCSMSMSTSHVFFTVKGILKEFCIKSKLDAAIWHLQHYYSCKRLNSRFAQNVWMSRSGFYEDWMVLAICRISWSVPASEASMIDRKNRSICQFSNSLNYSVTVTLLRRTAFYLKLKVFIKVPIACDVLRGIRWVLQLCSTRDRCVLCHSSQQVQ